MKKNYFLMSGMMMMLLSFFVLTNVAQAQLYINEFMASNDAALPGPMGDFPDWIEIYNAGDAPVSLAGYYMSDKLDEPEAMYQILSTYPDSVTVPAGGFLVFYANKEEASSVLNLDFKLSGDGEAVGLWDPSEMFLDSITYGPQYADTSYGRYQDGSASWYMMIDYTPGASNILNLSVNEIEDNASVSQNYPNPFSTETSFDFSLEIPDRVSIKIYDIRGTLLTVLTDELYTQGSHTVKWDASAMPAGYYIYMLQTSTSIITNKALIVR